MEKQYLYNAIKSGDLVSVKNFFELSTNEEISSAIFDNVEDGSGILQYILKLHQNNKKPVNVEIFGEVLRHCSDDIINTKDGNGEYPLLMAARTGEQFLCQFQNIHLIRKTKLLKRVNWKVTDNQGRGVLANAILSGDVECCNLVLNLQDALYHVRARENDSSNILHCLFSSYAAKPEQKAVFDVVLNKLKLLYASVENLESSTVFSLSNLLAEKNKLGETPLHLLAKSKFTNSLRNNVNFEEILESSNLLACTKDGETVIDLAVNHGNYVIIDFVLGKAERHFEGLRDKKNLVQQQKLQQQEGQSAQLVVQQGKLLDLEQEEEVRKDELHSRLQTACLNEKLRIQELLQSEVASHGFTSKMSAISEAKSKLALEKAPEERIQLQQEIERLEAEISNDKKVQEEKVEKVRCQLGNITVMHDHVNEAAELQRKVKRVRQEVSEAIRKLKLPLDTIGVLALQIKYQELLKLENSQYKAENLLFIKAESQEFIRKEVHSQVGKELKVIQRDLQRNRQECLKFIAGVLEGLQQDCPQRLVYIKELEELEEGQKQLIEYEKKLAQDRSSLQIESVLEDQRFLQGEVLNEIHVSQNPQQKDLLNRRLESVNVLVDITESVLYLRDKILGIEKLQVELDQVKRQRVTSGSAGLRLWVAEHIVLLDMKMRLQEALIQQVQKGEEVVKESNRQAILGDVQLPSLKVSHQELALEEQIQGVQYRLLQLRKLSLEVLDRELSNESTKQLDNQLEKQLKNLDKLKKYRNRIQENISDIQRSQKEGESAASETHMLQEEKKYIEQECKQLEKTIAILQKEIVEKKKNGMESILQGLKCALFENLNDRNFEILCNCRGMFGDYSSDDLELVSRIVKRYKKFNDIRKCHQYYKKVNDLGVDIGKAKHAIESRDIRLIKDMFYASGRADQIAFVREVLRIKDYDFLCDVVSTLGVSIMLDCMINCSEGENSLDYISPEAFVNIIYDQNITSDDYQKLAEIFAANGDLFDTVVREASSSGYFIADDIRNIASANRGNFAYTAAIMSRVEDFMFYCVVNDQMENLKPLLEYFPYMIYYTKDGKSLLETASDLQNTSLVSHIISMHREMIRRAVKGCRTTALYHLDPDIMQSFDQISKIHNQDVLSILKENKEFIKMLNPSARALLVLKVLDNAQKCGNAEALQYCAEVYPELMNRDLGYNLASIYDIKLNSATVSTTPLSKGENTLENMFPLSRGNIGQLGLLSQYIPIIRNGDINRFQKEIIDLFNNSVTKYAEKSHGEIGHTIFTLVAAFGNVEQWNKLVKGYQGIKQDKKTKNLFADIKNPLNGNKLSTLLSPFQAAVIKCNMQMIKYFMENITPEELSEVYGDNNNNIFHTMISEDQFNLVEDIIHSGKFSADALMKAFLQPNKKGITPFAIAAEKGYKRICIGFIYEIEQHKKCARDLMMNEVFIKNIVDTKDLDLLKELFSIECYTAKSIPKQRIRLTKHRIEGHNLLAYACEVGDQEFIKALMEYYNEYELFDILQEVIDPKLNITSDVLRMFLSDLISRSTDPEILEKVSRCVVHNANALAAFNELGYTADFLISQKLSIRDIIKQNNPQVFGYLIEKTGGDFWLKSDGGLSCLGLAVCYPDLLEVCCSYLKNNPDVALGNDVLPHSAVLSNNLELLGELIKRNPALLLAQYDVRRPLYKKIATQLKENYKCNFKSFETLYDFARRQNVDSATMDYLELALLNYCNNIVGGIAGNLVVNENLVHIVAKRADYVASKCPKLHSYIIDQFALEDTVRSIIQSGSNIFHLVTKENAEFLCAVAEKSYKRAIDLGDKNLQNLVRKMVNQINPSSGLSFFQYLALSGNYNMYKSIKLLCGDINSKTLQKKANLAHLCAYSGMKDEDGKFEFENLIKGNKKLAVASDCYGKGLLHYAAEGRVQGLEVRKEAFNLILSQKLDASIEKLSRNSYDKKVLNAAFISENQELSEAFLKRLTVKKRSDLIKQQKNLLRIVKNTPDPLKKGNLLSYEFDFAACAEASFGNRDKISDASKVSQSASAQLEAPRGDAALSSSLREDLSGSLADEMANVLPEDRIIVSKDKKEILDGQNEIESLIQKNGSIYEYTTAINKASSSSVLQLRPLSGEMSIAERAVLSGNFNFLEALINSNKKLNPNITDEHGNTLLHKFVEFLKRNPGQLLNRKVQYLFIELIRNYNFDISCRNQHGDTVLDMLQELGGNDVLPFMELLAQDYKVNQNYNQRFSKAKDTFFEYDSIYNVSNEIEASEVLQCKFSDLCYEVCRNILGNESVKYKSFADINYERLRKILNNNVVRKTLANTDANGDNFLQKLFKDIAAGKIKNDNIKLLELIEMIVNSLKDVDPELLQSLLFNSRNLKYENGVETVASVPGAYTVVKKLEELVGKRKISNACDFNTMLVNCAEAGNADLYCHIRENYAAISINNTDIHGNLSLHKAVITGSQETVEAVLSTGSNINKIDKDGNTPLHSLLIFMTSSPGMVTPRHIKLAEFLVSRGASLSIKNRLGIMPSQIAVFIDNSRKLNERFLDKQVGVLQSLINGRDRYYDIKSQCISKLKNCVRLEQSMKYDDIQLDIVGGILSTNMGGGKLQASKLLNSNFCQEHRLQTVKFSFSDEDGGYVQSVGKKRNYVVTDGLIKLKLSWKPVIPKGAKEQVVNVMVNSDGSVSLTDQDKEKYGKNGEKIHFDRCCVYLGGIKLEDALRDGRWKEQKDKGFLNQKVKSTTSLDKSRDSQDSVASQSLEASKPQTELDAMEKSEKVESLLRSHENQEESETLLPYVKSEDIYSPVDQREANMELLIQELPEVLASSEEKSCFLSNRIALKKCMDIFKTRVSSIETGKSFEKLVKSLCSVYSSMFLEYRKMLRKSSDEAFEKGLASRILKDYQSHMNMLLESLEAVLCLDVTLDCKILMKKICTDELRKYKSTCKRMCLQVENVPDMSSLPEIRESIFDDDLFDERKEEEQKVKTIEHSQGGSDEEFSLVEDVKKPREKKQKVLMAGLVPRIIESSTAKEAVKHSLHLDKEKKYILDLSKSGWNLERSGDVVKEKSQDDVSVEEESISDALLGSVSPLPSPDTKGKSRIQNR